MSAKTAHDKARCYLADGRLTVRQAGHAGVLAFVRGDSGLDYRTEWSPDLGWLCNCPAHDDACAHLAALRLVIVVNERNPK